MSEKRNGVFIKIIIVIAVLVILGGALFFFIQTYKPEWIDASSNQTNQTTQPQQPTQPDAEVEGEENNIWTFVGIILLGALVIGGTYLLLKNFKQSKGIEHPKVQVKADRAYDLFLQNFCMKYNIPCVYNPKKKIYVPKNNESITPGDRRPYYHTPTGDNFLFQEITVLEGNNQGVHIAIIPLDKGEEVIEGGWYRLDSNTLTSNFQLNRISYPMSSMQDKQDRLQLSMMENLDPNKMTPEMIQSMNRQKQPLPQQQPQNISTPLDALNDPEYLSQFPQNNQRTTSRRRTSTNSTRRYR